MDSSSIVSFNNDSTYQSTLKGECNNISVHELALHAMRDRCLLLQRRINTLETDNMRLKLDVTKSAEKAPYNPLQEDDKTILQHKIADLTKQKSQLLHHVFMVSCENKNLWSKLATLKGPEKNAILEQPKQPLVRTNTYIHSTPKCNKQYQEKYSDSSLEEISLKLINSYIQEKSQLVEQYEQMAQLQDVSDDILNVDSIGFAYIEDPALDSLKEIHSHTDKLQQLKNELAQQEKNLQTVLLRLENIMNNGYKCPSCLTSQAKNTSYENKETETSNSLISKSLIDTNSYEENFPERKTPTKNHLETSEIDAEPFDKICPICGDTFQNDTIFSDFQTHVENHFIGETDIDSIDNFDTISNSLDNVI